MRDTSLVLLTQSVLREIVAGRVDLVFRRWRKPTVKSGGRLRTSVGELTIRSVEIVDPKTIVDGDARRAGFPDAASLVADLFLERKGTGRARTAKPTDESLVYRVEVAFSGADTRALLRSTLLDEHELQGVCERLDGMDRRAKRGPWTARTLAMIAEWPGRRAPELAEMDGLETLVFKADVRKLKELGLTESLQVGYRLSARGEQVLRSRPPK